MKVLIVDDEKPSRDRIIRLLNNEKRITDIQAMESGKKAIACIKENKPDIIFMDINLRDMTGFDVLTAIKSDVNPVLIFVSAYDSFAMKAFDFTPLDFLLKPFKPERFYKSLENAFKLCGYQTRDHFESKIDQFISLQEKFKPVNQLPIKLGNKTIFVRTEEIKYILADRYYAEIYTAQNKHVMRQSLSHLIEVLDSESFCRIHRSTIVNKNFIYEIIHSDYSEIDIKMTDGKLFRVSRSHKKDVFDSLGI